MSAVRDWTDPEWWPTTPGTTSAWMECCPNCGSDFVGHCWKVECLMWVIVGCHGAHHDDVIAPARWSLN
jgi:hypothetical protein